MVKMEPHGIPELGFQPMILVMLEISILELIRDMYTKKPHLIHGHF